MSEEMRAILLVIDDCHHCDDAREKYRDAIDDGKLEVERYEDYGRRRFTELEELKVGTFPAMILEKEDGICEIDVNSLEVKKCVRKRR